MSSHIEHAAPGVGGALLLIAILCSAATAPLAFAAYQGEAKKPTEPGPGDKVQQHTETVTAGPHEYKIVFKGTVDGVMTRDPVGYGAYRQGFQPNLSVRLENIGETDVVNPWILLNGKRNWRTVEDIVAEAAVGCTTEREKAIAIWEFQKNHRFHACTWDQEVNDPVKVLNVYGYTLCGNDAHVLSDLWRAAGLTVRRGFPIGHVTAEAFFDGAFHLLDGDVGIICLLRDNETIASEADIVRDHDLMKRTHTYNLLSPDNRKTDEFSASLHWYEGERKGEHRSHIKHKMHFTLRPGESLEWRWDHVGKQYTKGTIPASGKWSKDGEGELLTGWGKTAYDNMRNGKLRYAPDLGREAGRRPESAENVRWTESGAVPSDGTKPAQVVWKIASPYVIVGARVSGEFTRAQAAIAAELSADGKTWTPVWSADKTGAFADSFAFDDKVSPVGKPQYEYFLRFTLKAAGAAADAGIRKIAFDTDVQMSALHLPELETGANTIRYADESAARQVRVTHEWIERTTMLPPPAPSAPLSPAQDAPDVGGATAEGTKLTFQWHAPEAPAGDKIADYHFQLSSRADMRWPLSPNFNKLSSRTAAKGKPEYALPYAGLLNPNQDYYWRVRARTDKMVWGPWSAVWRFRCDAPGVPLEPQIQPDTQPGGLVLSWKPNPVGRRPVKFKVYGSNEKGFSISDTEYKVFMGRGFCDTLEEFKAKTDKDPGSGFVDTPSNLLGETAETRLRVVGPDLTQPNANKAYYRVVAVDERGIESGPSDYAETPPPTSGARPFIFTQPPPQAAAGQEYRYQAGAISSIGHLTCKGGYNAAYWDREKLTWSLANAPDWLTADAKTGLVSGTPKTPGRFEATLVVENNKAQRATQTIVIEVRPR